MESTAQLCVSHDRYFLDNVAGWILELDRGHGIPWEGNYSSWLEQKGKRLKEEEKRAKYSEFACHELHFFLHQKDPAFFAKVANTSQYRETVRCCEVCGKP